MLEAFQNIIAISLVGKMSRRVGEEGRGYPPSRRGSRGRGRAVANAGIFTKATVNNCVINFDMTDI